MFQRLCQYLKKIDRNAATKFRRNRRLHYSPCEPRLLLHASAIISEVMFQPPEPNEAELAALPEVISSDFEYIELQNLAESPAIDLEGIQLSGDVDFLFGAEILNPGEIGVVVADPLAFQARYGESLRILGQWVGSLDDISASFVLADVDEHPIAQFQLNEADWPLAAYGTGASLEIVSQPTGSQLLLDRPYFWKAATEFGGTPGRVNSPASDVVINEVIANSVIRDSIELHNRSENSIDVSNWYLSDSADDLLKFRFPEGSSIDAHGFLTVFQEDYGPDGPTGFDLNGFAGGQVWLTAGDNDSTDLLLNQVSFGPQKLNIAWGRPASLDAEFVPLVETSINAENHSASFGQVLISEINYHPGQPSFEALEIDSTIQATDLEFVEIYNSVNESIDISNWQLTGATDFQFPEATQLGGFEIAVLVTFDPNLEENLTRLNAFRENYQIDESARLVGPIDGELSDRFGRLNLLQTGIPSKQDPETIPLFLHDVARFDEYAPWPETADGFGDSLARVATNAYGGTSDGWIAEVPSPGDSTLIPPPPKRLLISELMVSPVEPSAEELIELPDAVAEDFQFIELLNPNDERSIRLADYRIEGDIEITLPDESLAAGEMIIIAADTNAFQQRYGDGIRVIANWEGVLSNDVTQLTGLTNLDDPFVQIEIAWNRLWPLRSQGAGASLELQDPSSVARLDFHRPSQWKGSSAYGGTPGQPSSEPSALRISELLTNTEGFAEVTDSIEITNIGDDPIDVSGWFISDEASQLLKYRIPDDTIVDPGAYLVFDETHFNPQPEEPGPDDFSMDGVHGGQIWIVSTLDDQISTFIDEVAFGSQRHDASYSRVPTDSGSEFQPSHLTLESENSPLDLGPVLISEINFHPAQPTDAALEVDPTIEVDDLEFIELYNSSLEPMDLSGWTIQGSTDFTFGDQIEIEAQSTFILVSFDPAENQNHLDAFKAHYGIDGEYRIAGRFANGLPDEFGFLDLLQATEPAAGEPEFIPLIEHDRGRFDILPPWSSTSDGESLQRTSLDSQGSQAVAWDTSTANPGTTNLTPPPPFSLLVTEVMYFSPAPTSTELEVLPDAVSADFDFIEIFNPNQDVAIRLMGMQVSENVDLVFEDTRLAPHEYAVIVADAAAFETRYGDEIRILAEWTGELADNEPRIVVSDANGDQILDVSIGSDNRWPSRANGAGSSLEPKDPANLREPFQHPSLWRASVQVNGSPGAEPRPTKGIVINEVLAASADLPHGDFIEIFNPTDAPVDLSGWFLSDSADQLLKYQIPAETTLEPGDYLVIEESQIDPDPENPGLSAFTLDGVHGGEVWLIATEDGVVLEFADHVEFGAQRELTSWGRSPNGSGPFVANKEITIGLENSAADLGPIIISEVLFNPEPPNDDSRLLDPAIEADHLQFIELYNSSEDDIELFGWSVTGTTQLEFAEDVVLPSHELVVVVNFESSENANRANAFRTHYGIDRGVPLVGGFDGLLNDFGTVGLTSSSTDEGPPFAPGLLRDEIRYDNIAPWPGTSSGQSLNRLDVNSLGNFAESWSVEGASPGTSVLVPPSPLMLPDLSFWVDPLLGFNQIEFLDTHRSTERKLMRFTTASVNIGQGPLTLEGRNNVNGAQQVFQTIQREDGTTLDRLAGEFVFHPTHNHIHFDDYAEYNLREISEDGGMGPVIASGAKISFCLIDFSPFDLNLPGAPTKSIFSQCERSVQGMSVGWADIYSADLDDQWIDIQDVPPGEYWFETVIDPANLLLESDETNNSFASKVVLGVPEYNKDIFDADEINLVGLGTGDKTLSDLSIHQPGEIDTFRWIAPADGQLDVRIDFDGQEGDADLYVWGRSETSRQILIESATEDSFDSGSVDVTAGTAYFIVVKDLSGNTISNYNLTVDGPEIQPDDYENNDVFLSASDLGTDDAFITGLNAHQAGDRDYFAWTATESGSLFVDIRFAENEGKLNLFLYDFGNNLIVEATKLLNRRELLADVEAGETYLISVIAKEDDFSTNYNLRLDFLDTPNDAHEPNDSLETPADIGSGDVRVTDLNIHAPFNDDFYRWRPTSSGIAQIDLSFIHAEGDLDLVIWSAGEVVDRVSSEDDNETYTLVVVADDQYVIEVVGKDGATNLNYSLDLQSPDLPKVLAAKIGGSGRQHDLLDIIFDDQEVDPIHLPGMDQIVIQFNNDVVIGEEDWNIAGEEKPEYDVAFRYDDRSSTATWEFAEPLTDDRVTFVLKDSITDRFLNPLDGEWSESSNLPSGDGESGGDFVLHLRVRLGDLTGDDLVDIGDIDALSVGLQNQDPAADLNGDGFYGEDDIRLLVTDIMNSVIGDSNLDGVFDSSDLIVVFQAGQYEDEIDQNSSWAEGDWNLDGEFDTNDLVFAFQEGAYVNQAIGMKASLKRSGFPDSNVPKDFNRFDSVLVVDRLKNVKAIGPFELVVQPANLDPIDGRPSFDATRIGNQRSVVVKGRIFRVATLSMQNWANIEPFVSEIPNPFGT